MNSAKTIVVLLSSFVLEFSFAQQKDSLCTPNDAIGFIVPNDKEESQIFFKKETENNLYAPQTFHLQKKAIEYPPTKRDFKKLSYNTGLFFGSSVITFGILYAAPSSFTHWNKERIKQRGIFYEWKKHTKHLPTGDHDSWTVNYVGHPYFGALYYITARSSGFTRAESFMYSTLMSTFFWEYGLESFAEKPSTQDVIATPVLGSVVGECFVYAKKNILENDRKILRSRFLGITTLILMDPFNTLLDASGYKQKNRAQFAAQPVGFDYKTGNTIWGLSLKKDF